MDVVRRSSRYLFIGPLHMPEINDTAAPPWWRSRCGSISGSYQQYLPKSALRMSPVSLNALWKANAAASE